MTDVTGAATLKNILDTLIYVRDNPGKAHSQFSWSNLKPTPLQSSTIGIYNRHFFSFAVKLLAFGRTDLLHELIDATTTLTIDGDIEQHNQSHASGKYTLVTKEIPEDDREQEAALTKLIALSWDIATRTCDNIPHYIRQQKLNRHKKNALKKIDKLIQNAIRKEVQNLDEITQLENQKNEIINIELNESSRKLDDENFTLYLSGIIPNFPYNPKLDENLTPDNLENIKSFKRDLNRFRLQQRLHYIKFVQEQIEDEQEEHNQKQEASAANEHSRLLEITKNRNADAFRARTKEDEEKILAEEQRAKNWKNGGKIISGLLAIIVATGEAAIAAAAITGLVVLVGAAFLAWPLTIAIFCASLAVNVLLFYTGNQALYKDMMTDATITNKEGVTKKIRKFFVYKDSTGKVSELSSNQKKAMIIASIFAVSGGLASGCLSYYCIGLFLAGFSIVCPPIALAIGAVAAITLTCMYYRSIAVLIKNQEMHEKFKAWVKETYISVWDKDAFDNYKGFAKFTAIVKAIFKALAPFIAGAIATAFCFIPGGLMFLKAIKNTPYINQVGIIAIRVITACATTVESVFRAIYLKYAIDHLPNFKDIYTGIKNFVSHPIETTKNWWQETKLFNLFNGLAALINISVTLNGLGNAGTLSTSSVNIIGFGKFGAILSGIFTALTVGSSSVAANSESANEQLNINTGAKTSTTLQELQLQPVNNSLSVAAAAKAPRANRLQFFSSKDDFDYDHNDDLEERETPCCTGLTSILTFFSSRKSDNIAPYAEPQQGERVSQNI